MHCIPDLLVDSQRTIYRCIGAQPAMEQPWPRISTKWGTLAVDFVATRLNRAVWMGMATKTLLIKNPEKDIDKAC
ncbi:MAG: hypothetical protein O7D93_02310 [Acidobacteria bacterium]|nr:hypothetical protein [Acidobacteriota bacterium]